MRRPNDEQVKTARRLIAQEGQTAEDADDCAVAGRLHAKLFARLASLIGTSGARALWERSMKLTASEFPVLGKVDFKAKPTDSPADVLVTCLRGEAPEAIRETAVAVCAMLLALLATLIGERLTIRVLRAAWPDFDAPNEENEEKE